VSGSTVWGTVSLAMTTDWEEGVAHLLAQAYLREVVTA
jgi:hypothetical protein